MQATTPRSWFAPSSPAAELLRHFVEHQLAPSFLEITLLDSLSIHGPINVFLTLIKACWSPGSRWHHMCLQCITQLGWMRAARTDKGVSAVGNVVSLKLMIDFPHLLERINNALPSQVGHHLTHCVGDNKVANDACDAPSRQASATHMTQSYIYIPPTRNARAGTCCRGASCKILVPRPWH